MLISLLSVSDGRLLIELRGDGDRGRWMSAPSNKVSASSYHRMFTNDHPDQVYWPPGPPSSLSTGSPGLLSSRLDSTASQHTTGRTLHYGKFSATRRIFIIGSLNKEDRRHLDIWKHSSQLFTLKEGYCSHYEY